MVGLGVGWMIDRMFVLGFDQGFDQALSAIVQQLLFLGHMVIDQHGLLFPFVFAQRDGRTGCKFSTAMHLLDRCAAVRAFGHHQLIS